MLQLLLPTDLSHLRASPPQPYVQREGAPGPIPRIALEHVDYERMSNIRLWVPLTAPDPTGPLTDPALDLARTIEATWARAKAEGIPSWGSKRITLATCLDFGLVVEEVGLAQLDYLGVVFFDRKHPHRGGPACRVPCALFLLHIDSKTTEWLRWDQAKDLCHHLSGQWALRGGGK